MRQLPRQPVAVANSIHFSRQDPRCKNLSWLLVEGIDDIKLYERVLDDTACRIHAQDGVDRVISALKYCKELGLPGVLAVIDRDYRSQSEVDELCADYDLCVTDSRDFETMMLCSQALESVVSEYFPARDRNQPLPHVTQWIRKYLLEAALPIGLLRKYAAETKLGWSFRDASAHPERYIEFAELRAYVNEEKLIELVSLKDSESANATHFLENARASLSDPWRIVQGHDCVSLLEFILPIAHHRFRNNVDSRPVRVDIAQILRTAFKAEIQNTNIFQFFKRWQFNNLPYRILHKS